jgi:hypothetical protein
MDTIEVHGRTGLIGRITHGWQPGREDWYSITYGGHGTPTLTSLKLKPSPEQIERELARLQKRIQETAALYGR